MTEQTPQDEAREGAKQKHEPRDAAYWAQRIERLEVSDVPEGAANVNVQGRREVGALQGFGQLWRAESSEGGSLLGRDVECYTQQMKYQNDQPSNYPTNRAD
jgi:hypothetical protein